ncbi:MULTISPECIES: IS982 family transposase [Lactobacillus]|nr:MULTISPECIES: IS982 family transposase [Lactobacillus]CDA27199.1 putative transposase [Lactobacillus amylovorus CAG:719]AEB92359.1 putative transposase [Lactobacillus johnsonii DPC 6026]ATO53497.1 transposase [Lactobacillus amylovorus DSM 20531]AUX16392.1 transposase [Lactobacillus amylovorus]AUX16598.1 transposase [Lactobacillus amylovorus]
MNYPKLKRFSHHLQVSFSRLNIICRCLYKLYAPDALKQRRNINRCKISDSSILALLIWQASLGVESQRRFCEKLVNLSHSRFNRRARMLLPLIYLIRHGLNEEVDLSGDILIIDSFPVPVCQPIRNRRAKIFRGYADIGYKATKKIYYYGFKVHAIVSDDGYLLDYIVTKASVHDAKETVELITNAHPDNRYLLGDEGYLGKNLHQRLEQMGYTLWTPYRKNMKNAQKHNKHYLMALRRTIESDFSLLSYYNAENNRARSLAGFQERLEVAILAYNMAYCLERFN